MDINWQKQGVEALSYLKGLGNKVKQIALQLTEIEVKVEDATNNEPWGPHGKDMAGEPGFLEADQRGITEVRSTIQTASREV